MKHAVRRVSVADVNLAQHLLKVNEKVIGKVMLAEKLDELWRGRGGGGMREREKEIDREIDREK